MYKRLLLIPLVVAAVVVPSAGQSQSMRATMRGGGGDRGKCTIEVRVDGAADVEIRGDRGFLRTLSGQPAQWRRFECTGPMPVNPADFKFHGVDGRGRQELIRDPRNSGMAVVRIEDSSGGSEGYTFDLEWRADYGVGGGSQGGQWPGQGTGNDARRAIDTCRAAVRDRAFQQFGTRDVEIRNIDMDNNRGRNDWVVGTADLRRGGNRWDSYRFACSVDFSNGRVRSVDITPDSIGGGYQSRATESALEACRSEVRQRLRRDGYRNIEIRSIAMDNNPGRNDWLSGSVSARRSNDFDEFGFACSMDFNSGYVRSVDIRRR